MERLQTRSMLRSLSRHCCLVAWADHAGWIVIAVTPTLHGESLDSLVGASHDPRGAGTALEGAEIVQSTFRMRVRARFGRIGQPARDGLILSIVFLALAP